MADVDYESWCEFVVREASKRGYRGGPALDLGCGTGNSTVPLHRRGFEVTGLDSSPEMLAVARDKLPQLDWRLGEFSSFDLPARFSLVVSMFDSLNNLLSADEFRAAAARVAHHLLPGGLFLFDVNTAIGLRELWEGGRVEGWAEEVHYSWLHSFDAYANLARVEASWESGGRRHSEVHYERPFEADETVALLADAGFEEIEVLNFPDGSVAPPDAERIWLCARLSSGRGQSSPGRG